MAKKITGQEYVQYLTEQLLEYIETPNEQRKLKKKEAKLNKEQWLIKWFGVGGASVFMWMKKRKD